MGKVKKLLGAAALVGAGMGIEAGIKWLEWYKDYCKLVPYKIDSIKNTQIEDKEDIKLIAHRGYRAVAPENTLPAYEEAGKAGFWGAECDIYRTIDGVWVLHHDPVTYRMMDKSGYIELMTYDQLMKYNYSNGHNIDKYPNLKVCKLEEFFKACEKYGMTAVVGIKYNHTIMHFDELVEIASRYNIDVQYIAFSFADIVKMRKLCDNDLFYLVYDIKDKQIERALSVENCGISYDGNDERNLENDCARIRKCHEAGLVTATWAVDDLEKIEKIANAGTKYITTNSVLY